MADFTFAIYQTWILPMASGALADCKFFVCRRQMKRLPSASVSLADALADCKFFVCRRQMKRLPSASVSLADGKFLFFKRQICQPPAKGLNAT